MTNLKLKSHSLYLLASDIAMKGYNSKLHQLVLDIERRLSICYK